MNDADIDNRTKKPARVTGYRLVRIIIVETVLVAFAGLMVWGVAWEMGYSRIGQIAAIVIWLIVSPVIEIATVLKYRGPGADVRVER